MADDEKKFEGTSRGNEWEVVSLTASTYEAAPGPKEFESTGGDKVLNRTEEESSRAMFMSGHFVFPPSQHENLPLEPDISEIHDELRGEGPDSTEECGPDLAEGDGPKKSADDNWNIKEISDVDEQLGLQLFDEKGKRLSFPSTKLEEGKDFLLQGLNLLEEHSLYGAAKLSSFHAEADMSGSTAFDGSAIIPKDRDPTQNKLDSPLDSSKYQDTTKEDKSVPPCEAWWKKQAASLYSHAKEANTFWSVVVAPPGESPEEQREAWLAGQYVDLTTYGLGYQPTTLPAPKTVSDAESSDTESCDSEISVSDLFKCSVNCVSVKEQTDEDQSVQEEDVEPVPPTEDEVK